MDEFKVAFQQGCPKFLSPTTVVYEGNSVAKVFVLMEIKNIFLILRSHSSANAMHSWRELRAKSVCQFCAVTSNCKFNMKWADDFLGFSYTTLPIQKLASFMDITDGNWTHSWATFTHKMIVTELGKETMDKDAVTDDYTDLDFYVDKVGFVLIKHFFKLNKLCRI